MARGGVRHRPVALAWSRGTPSAAFMRGAIAATGRVHAWLWAICPRGGPRLRRCVVRSRNTRARPWARASSPAASSPAGRPVPPAARGRRPGPRLGSVAQLCTVCGTAGGLQGLTEGLRSGLLVRGRVCGQEVLGLRRLWARALVPGLKYFGLLLETVCPTAARHSGLGSAASMAREHRLAADGYRWWRGVPPRFSPPSYEPDSRSNAES